MKLQLALIAVLALNSAFASNLDWARKELIKDGVLIEFVKSYNETAKKLLSAKAIVNGEEAHIISVPQLKLKKEVGETILECKGDFSLKLNKDGLEVLATHDAEFNHNDQSGPKPCLNIQRECKEEKGCITLMIPNEEVLNNESRLGALNQLLGPELGNNYQPENEVLIHLLRKNICEINLKPGKIRIQNTKPITVSTSGKISVFALLNPLTAMDVETVKTHMDIQTKLGDLPHTLTMSLINCDSGKCESILTKKNVPIKDLRVKFMPSYFKTVDVTCR